MSKRKATRKNEVVKNQLSLDLQTSLVTIINNSKSVRLSVVVSNFCTPNTSTVPPKLLDPNSPEITRIIREKANALGW